MKIGLDFAYYSKYESNTNSIQQILDPTNTLKEIGLLLIENLENHGHTVINCSPTPNDSSTNLIESILKTANNEPLDLFISLTLNSFSNSARHGSEIIVSEKEGLVFNRAKKIQNKLYTLGYSNRGISKNMNLDLLNNLNCPSMLVKCFYSTNPWDCNRYNKSLIADALCKALSKEDSIMKNISC